MGFEPEYLEALKLIDSIIVETHGYRYCFKNKRITYIGSCRVRADVSDSYDSYSLCYGGDHPRYYGTFVYLVARKLDFHLGFNAYEMNFTSNIEHDCSFTLDRVLSTVPEKRSINSTLEFTVEGAREPYYAFSMV